MFGPSLIVLPTISTGTIYTDLTCVEEFAFPHGDFIPLFYTHTFIVLLHVSPFSHFLWSPSLEGRWVSFCPGGALLPYLCAWEGGDYCGGSDSMQEESVEKMQLVPTSLPTIYLLYHIIYCTT